MGEKGIGGLTSRSKNPPLGYQGSLDQCPGINGWGRKTVKTRDMRTDGLKYPAPIEQRQSGKCLKMSKVQTLQTDRKWGLEQRVGTLAIKIIGERKQTKKSLQTRVSDSSGGASIPGQHRGSWQADQTSSRSPGVYYRLQFKLGFLLFQTNHFLTF